MHCGFLLDLEERGEKWEVERGRSPIDIPRGDDSMHYFLVIEFRVR